MLRLIVYDIAHPRRLLKVAQVCEDYGSRVEKSVFECDLDDELFAHFWQKLANIVDSVEDRLIAYRICASCAEKIQYIGTVERPQKPLLYIM